MRSKKMDLVLVLAIGLAAGSTHAEDGFSLSGYGTLGLVRTNTSMGEFASTVTAPSGARNKWDASVDSRLGIQADWRHENWSATAQVASLKTGEDDFSPQLMTANVKYRINDQFEVRAGRIAMPIYAISDYRNVGYAYTWVRPPLEVYYTLPYNTLDGASLMYRTRLGDGNFRFEPFYGNNKGFWYFGAQGDGKPIKGFQVGYEIGDWDLRAMALKINVVYDNPGLAGIFQGMRASGIPSVAALADRLTTADGKSCDFNSVGATYNDGQLFYTAEYVYGPCKSFIAGIYGWTNTLGYRIGAFTPYAVVSSQISKRKHDADLMPDIPALAGLRAAVNAIETAPKQKSMAVGVRWDAYKNIALKAQYDRIRTSASEPSLFVNAQPGLAGKTVGVMSLALDFVF